MKIEFKNKIFNYLKEIIMILFNVPENVLIIEKLKTNLIILIIFATGQSEVLGIFQIANYFFSF